MAKGSKTVPQSAAATEYGDDNGRRRSTDRPSADRTAASTNEAIPSDSSHSVSETPNEPVPETVPGPVPAWLIERAAVGEVPAAQRQRVRTLLAKDERAQAQLDALRADNAAILAAYAPDAVVAEIERRRRVAAAVESTQEGTRNPSGWRWPLMLSGVAGAAAVMGLLFLSEGTGPRVPDNVIASNTTNTDRFGNGVAGGFERHKGEPQLIIHRKRGREVVRLERNAVVGVGDLLQLSYVPRGQPYGTILSLDGNGAVTLHYPDQVDGDTALGSAINNSANSVDDRKAGRQEGGKEGRFELPHAYELDDAPKFEHFVFITSADRIDVREVLTQAERLARRMALQEGAAERAQLELAAGVKQVWFSLRKESAP